MFVIIYFILLGGIIFSSHDLRWAALDLSYVKCGSTTGIPRPLPQMTTMAYTFLMVIVPIVLVATGIFTLIKALADKNTDEIAKAKSKLIKKFLTAAVTLLLLSIVRFVIFQVTTNSEDKATATSCFRCFLFYNEQNCLPSDTGNDVKRGFYYSEPDSDFVNDTESNRSNYPQNSNSNSSTTQTVQYTADDHTVEVLRNIIYAVETGGQVYGGHNYADFTEAYTNTPNEHAITIGAGGWFATEAQRLLKMIRDEAPETFRKLDTAGIGNDLDTADWSTYKLSEGSAKANAIVAIIDSPDGHAMQDKLMDQQVKEMMQLGIDRGVTDPKALGMFIEIKHCAGLSGAERMLGHASKPYTADSIYAAVTQSYPGDEKYSSPINGPLYRSRHDTVYKMLQEHM